MKIWKIEYFRALQKRKEIYDAPPHIEIFYIRARDNLLHHCFAILHNFIYWCTKWDFNKREIFAGDREGKMENRWQNNENLLEDKREGIIFVMEIIWWKA